MPRHAADPARPGVRPDPRAGHGRGRWLWLGPVLAAGLWACAVADNAVDRSEMYVSGHDLYISGEITSRTPANFAALLEANPQVRRIVPLTMPGSLDDGAVLRMGREIRARGLATHLTGQSEIYSGAVDLFVAGVRRSAAPGAVIGVHAWEDGFGAATSYPPGAPEHRDNAAYAREMLGDDGFYWFTLTAAPPEAIHIMTQDDIARFGILTGPAPRD